MVLWLVNQFMNHFKQVLRQLMHLYQSVEDKESLLLVIDKQVKQRLQLILSLTKKVKTLHVFM